VQGYEQGRCLVLPGAWGCPEIIQANVMAIYNNNNNNNGDSDGKHVNNGKIRRNRIL